MYLKNVKRVYLVVAVNLAMLLVLCIPWSALAVPVPAVKPAAPGRLLFFQQGAEGLTLSNPDGTEQQQLNFTANNQALLSPDGKQVASLAFGFERVGWRTPACRLCVRGLGKDDPTTTLEVYASTFAWSPDGSQLAVSDFDPNQPPEKFEATHSFVNVKTKEQTPLPLPPGQFIRDWSRDGKYLLTEQRRTPNGRVTGNRLFLMNVDGTEAKAITPEKASFSGGRLSPDGRRLLALGYGSSKPGTLLRRIPVVFEVATGKMTQVPGLPENAETESCCWSQDGKRIAYSWKELPEGKVDDAGYNHKETSSRVTVCDVDGSNARNIGTAKAESPLFTIFGCIDWR
jgi:hypothetical protein